MSSKLLLLLFFYYDNDPFRAILNVNIGAHNMQGSYSSLICPNSFTTFSFAIK